METCLLRINGSYYHNLKPQPFFPKSSIQCLPSPRGRKAVSCAPAATANGPTSGDVAVSPAQSPRSVRQPAQRARQDALTDVRNSSDLKSSLAKSAKTLRVQDLNIILREFRKQNRWTDLTQLFEWMQKHGKANSSSYSSYIKFLGDNRNPVKALEIYNEINDETIRSSDSVCNSVLSCLVKNGHLDKAIDLFYQMQRSGLQPNIVTYSTLLAGFIKVTDGYYKAMQLVKEAEQKKLKMDSVSYGILIAICASNGLCKEAEEYFLRMKAEGHSPNMYHYSSLLNAYSADGNYQSADKLVRDMKSAALAPNKVILTTMLKVYVRAGLFERSRQLLLELEDLGYADDEIPYCLLMDAFSKSGQINEAKAVFNEMNRRQVKSDGYAHSIMISAHCRCGQLEEANKLARDYEAKSRKYDVVIFNTMLCAYCRLHDMESVMQVMRKMDMLAVSPDRHTFQILIRYFCKENLYLLAYRTLEDMHNKGYQPSEETCTALISHLGKTGSYSEAYTVYNILRYNSRAVCKDIHEKILHILLTGQLFKEAFVVAKDNADRISEPAMKKFLTIFTKFGNINLLNEVVKLIGSYGYKIDQDVFQLAISRYVAEPEKKELLLQLLKWMPSQGYIVDSESRNLLLKNSHSYGHRVIAELLSKQHSVARAKRNN